MSGTQAPSSLRIAVAATMFCLWIGPARSEAHQFGVTGVVAILGENGTYRIDMTVDVDAIALGVPSTVDSEEVVAHLRAMTPEELAAVVRQAEETVARRVRVRFDGEKQTPEISFPDYGTTAIGASPIPTVLGTTARLTGPIPKGAREFSFGASRGFPPVHLSIVEEATLGRASHLLSVSEDSPPYVLGGTAPPPDRLTMASRYLMLGFEHIVPLGVDHILFVLGLFLLSPRLRPLLWQVTAFTVAHSVSLALSMYGVVSLPSTVVEPLIALSITCVAAENLLTSRLYPWRPAVVFGFGLLHGLGFAGVLRELGLPAGEYFIGLISFNVGVELGQLAVVGTAFTAVGWLRHRSWYRAAITVPLSIVVGCIGLYWCIERAAGA